MSFKAAALVVMLLCCGVTRLQAKSQQGSKENELFLMCDLNSDGQISVKELRKCAKFPKSKSDIAEEVFRVFDKDRNGFLTESEYIEFVSMAFESKETSSKTEKKQQKDSKRKNDDYDDDEEEEDIDEEVEVIDRNGKKQIMKKSAFDQMNQEKMKGLSLEEGEMTKVEEGETTLEKAREENPELARVLALGKWIQTQLAKEGFEYATGKMLNMKTIDDREEGADRQKHLQENKDFEMKFEVKIRASEKKNSAIKVFEVWVERNRDLYIKPHLAMTKLWQVQGSKRIELATPEPELRSALVRIYLGPFIRSCGTPILLLLLGTVLWCTVATCRNLSSNVRREKMKMKKK